MQQRTNYERNQRTREIRRFMAQETPREEKRKRIPMIDENTTLRYNNERTKENTQRENNENTQ